MSKKKVLVTGSSSGIGLSIAEHLLSLGYEVVQTGRRELDLPNYFRADLMKRDELQALLDFAGQIDILINNAGEYIYAPVEKVSYDELSMLVDLNFMAPYVLISKLVPYMKQKNWGRIVNIGSISGVVGEGNASLYSATKSAFLGLTKSLGLELAQYGITANLINPGWVNTQLADAAICTGDFSHEECIETIPQKRFIEPIEVAHLVQYFISEESKGVTGQSINLCAGLSVG